MKKADLIIIAVTAAVVLALFIFLYGVNNASGAYVQIEIDGEIAEILPLDTEAVRVIRTDNGGENTLVIKDGKAEVSEANCPDGICKNHSAIYRSGETIICLPHKVVIAVVNESDADGVDAAA